MIQTLSALDQFVTSLKNFSAAADDNAPIEWASQYCAMLNPANSTHWWNANEWKHAIFYQIADRTPGEGAALTVNGQGSYHLVVVSSGKEAWREIQPCRWEKQSQRKKDDRNTSDFLEGGNADPSRDGDAYSPTKEFVSWPIVKKTRSELTANSTGECSSNASIPDSSAFPMTVFNDRLAF